MNKQALCWMDGRVVPAAEAHISIYDHGLLYGDGVFEGLRFYQRRVFRLQAHLQRLQQSANAISLSLPLNLHQITGVIEQLIAAGDMNDGYLRMVVTRGAGNLGIDPRKCAAPNLFIIADELSVVNQSKRGIKLHIASTRSMPAQCLDPKIKSLNYLNHILARIEANTHGADESLMLNIHGMISEGTVDNIFIVTKGKLLTPPVSDGLLQGITRDVILQIADELDIPCGETSLTIYDVINADECFLTGTGAELIPVVQIDHHLFEAANNPMFPIIESAFLKKVKAECH
jgi:branched-chain amino acid aminotransferase